MNSVIDNSPLPFEIRGESIPLFGISKFVNPRKNSKFSPNFHRFLSYSNKHLTNVFQDPESGYYYIGLRDENGIWIGANLMRVFCVGNSAKTFSYATSVTKKWNDVSDWFWKTYLEVGKKIYDLPEWKNIQS